MINLKTSKKVPTINVKVDPITNIHVADARASANVSVSNDSDKTNISEISACSNVSSVEELDALKRENQVLKLVIDILHSNPLVINKKIPTIHKLFKCFPIISSKNKPAIAAGIVAITMYQANL